MTPPPRTPGGTKRIRVSSNDNIDIALPTPITPSSTVHSVSIAPPSSPSQAKRRKWTQLSLDVGQRDVASRRCADCGMVYAAGVDDSEHEKYHRNGKNKLVRFTKTTAKGMKPVNVMRDTNTAYYVMKEVTKVVRGVHATATRDLGGNGQSIDDINGRFILAVKDSEVVGYCMFERISSANIMGMRETDYAIFDCRRSVQGTLLGIRYLWVAKQHRRIGIANELIDTARNFGTYGHVFQRNKIAFTPPTRAGAQFALSYAPLKVRIRAALSKSKEDKQRRWTFSLSTEAKEEKEQCGEDEKEEKGRTGSGKEEKGDAGKKDVAGYIFVYRPSSTLTTERK